MTPHILKLHPGAMIGRGNMHRHKPFAFTIRIILSALLVSIFLPLMAAEGTLVIGKVSNSPQKNLRQMQPMVDYVVAQMGDLGITRGEVLIAKNDDQMIRYIKEGRVDWVTEGLFASFKYRERAGSDFILRKWKKGVSEYRTVFITRKGSGIEGLADLKGRRIAFEDPGSTSAYFLPKVALIDRGLEPVALASPGKRPPGEKVGYAFAGAELNISAWVYKGLVDAGAYSDLDWDSPESMPQAIRKDLKIFHTTFPAPRAIESVRGDLEPAIKKRLIEILVAADQSPTGREALMAYHQSSKIDPIDAEIKAQIEQIWHIMQQLPKDL